MSSQTVASPAAGRRSRGLIVALAGTLLLGAAGAGAYFYFVAPDVIFAAREPRPAPPPATAIVSLDPFVVNLADAAGTRFLRASLALVVHETQARSLEQDPMELARVRSGVLELLAEQHGSRLVTPEGKAELKDAIGGRVAQIAPGTQVTDVLFSEFIVQF